LHQARLHQGECLVGDANRSCSPPVAGPVGAFHATAQQHVRGTPVKSFTRPHAGKAGLFAVTTASLDDAALAALGLSRTPPAAAPAPATTGKKGGKK
jgi:hypothetical protein